MRLFQVICCSTSASTTRSSGVGEEGVNLREGVARAIELRRLIHRGDLTYRSYIRDYR